MQEEQDCLERLLDISRGRLPEPQFSFYEVDEVRDGRVYKLPVERYLTKGWCIEREGPRVRLGRLLTVAKLTPTGAGLQRRVMTHLDVHLCDRGRLSPPVRGASRKRC